jgi:hypothetical protein
VSQSEKERAAEPKEAPRDRELSDSDLESVAGGVKGETPLPPGGKPTKP